MDYDITLQRLDEETEQLFNKLNTVDQEIAALIQGDQAKRKTTYDLALEALTVEYPPVEIGTTQVMNGVTFKFDGKEWIAQ
jgi:hypothetical protein